MGWCQNLGQNSKNCGKQHSCAKCHVATDYHYRKSSYQLQHNTNICTCASQVAVCTQQCAFDAIERTHTHTHTCCPHASDTQLSSSLCKLNANMHRVSPLVPTENTIVCFREGLLALHPTYGDAGSFTASVEPFACTRHRRHSAGAAVGLGGTGLLQRAAPTVHFGPAIMQQQGQR
jgi:hypothetical protein